MHEGRIQVLRRSRWTTAVAVGVALSLAVAGCGNTVGSSSGSSGGGASKATGGGKASSGNVQAATSLSGAGSTFVGPYYSKAFKQLAQDKGIQVNYQLVGSGAGIQDFINKTVDFADSDAPMTDQQMKQAGGNPQHIAVVGGGVTLAYNVKGVKGGLKLDGPTIANIFLGKIKKWNDPAIKKLNPGVNLPNENIVVVHRSDSSGTSAIFTTYLSSVSPEWKSKVGASTTPNWPTGVGAKGNDGVAGQITRTQGAIGYVELAYALTNKITYASVKNASGNFVKPSLDSAKAAIAGAKIPSDLRVIISGTNPQGKNAYPIVGLTWMLVRQQEQNLAKCKAIAETAWYVTHQGQKLAPSLQYVQIPPKVQKIDEQKIKSMEAGGKKCYTG